MTHTKCFKQVDIHGCVFSVGVYMLSLEWPRAFINPSADEAELDTNRDELLVILHSSYALGNLFIHWILKFYVKIWKENSKIFLVFYRKIFLVFYRKRFPVLYWEDGEEINFNKLTALNVAEPKSCKYNLFSLLREGVRIERLLL